MDRVVRRSRELTEGWFSESTWERSHVVVDEAGKVRTYCVHAAPTEEIVRAHSTGLGRHRIESLEEIAGDVTPADLPTV